MTINRMLNSSAMWGIGAGLLAVGTIMMLAGGLGHQWAVFGLGTIPTTIGASLMIIKVSRFANERFTQDYVNSIMNNNAIGNDKL